MFNKFFNKLKSNREEAKKKAKENRLLQEEYKKESKLLQEVLRNYKYFLLQKKDDSSAQTMVQAVNYLGQLSDGYHTFDELYYYRMLYNAGYFNELAKIEGNPYDVHKSVKHSDGEDCFGGGWFIVVAELPTGQVTNHYKIADWEYFILPEKETANVWDGHTPEEAAERIAKFIEEQANTEE